MQSFSMICPVFTRNLMKRVFDHISSKEPNPQLLRVEILALMDMLTRNRVMDTVAARFWGSPTAAPCDLKMEPMCTLESFSRLYYIALPFSSISMGPSKLLPHSGDANNLGAMATLISHRLFTGYCQIDMVNGLLRHLLPLLRMSNMCREPSCYWALLVCGENALPPSPVTVLLSLALFPLLVVPLCDEVRLVFVFGGGDQRKAEGKNTLQPPSVPPVLQRPLTRGAWASARRWDLTTGEELPPCRRP